MLTINLSLGHYHPRQMNYQMYKLIVRTSAHFVIVVSASTPFSRVGEIIVYF